MILLKVSATTQPRETHCHELDILGHHLRKLMCIVPVKANLESLWQPTQDVFILFCLELGGRSRADDAKAEQSQDYFHLFVSFHRDSHVSPNQPDCSVRVVRVYMPRIQAPRSPHIGMWLFLSGLSAIGTQLPGSPSPSTIRKQQKAFPKHFVTFTRVFRARHAFAGTFPMMDRINKRLEDVKLSVGAAAELPGTRTTYSVFQSTFIRVHWEPPIL